MAAVGCLPRAAREPARRALGHAGAGPGHCGLQFAAGTAGAGGGCGVAAVVVGGVAVLGV